MVEGTERMERGGWEEGGEEVGALASCMWLLCLHSFFASINYFSNSYNCSLLCLHLDVQLLNHRNMFFLASSRPICMA